MSAEKKQEVDVAPAQAEPTLAAPKDQEMGALEIEQPKDEPKKTLTWKEWAVETFVDDKWFWLIIVILLLANIGIYSFAIASKRTDAYILSFEPTPGVFEKLSFNINSNNLSDKIKVLNLALSNKKGEMKFNTNLESLVLGEGNITVKTDTLLNVLNANVIKKVSALKIDVEGAEDQILKPFFENAPKSLWPRMIVIERVFPEQWKWDCISFIETNGYEKIWIGKFNTVYNLIQF